MSKEKKLPILVSPKGPAAYAWLAKKDTKYSKEGVYKVTLVLDRDDMDEGRVNYGKEALPGRDWVKHVLHMCKEAGASTEFSAPGCPIKDGNKMVHHETGVPKPEFANKLLIPFKSAYKPALIDTKGNELPSQIPVFSGDIVKIAMQPVARTVKGVTYMSLYLSKVMLVEKKTGGSGDVSMFGEEDGFSVSDKDASGTADDADFGDTSGVDVTSDDIDF